MKKATTLFIYLILISSFSFADNMPTEQDYQNLDELRVKLVRMKKEMDRFMKDIINTSASQGQYVMNELDQDVRVDVSQTAKDITVKADLPGMDKDKIEVTLQNNRILKIGGSRDIAKKETSPGMVRQERLQGKFQRIIELPVDCMNEGIKASYQNGVLDIVIPKKQVTKEEAVKINVQ